MCGSHAEETADDHHVATRAKPHCCDHKPDDAEEESGHHGGCPGHDDKGNGCDCAQLTATIAQSDQNFTSPVAIALIVEQVEMLSWLAPVSLDVGCTRPVWAVPRQASSLLRLHCALTV
jgi:hypothetical protein